MSWLKLFGIEVVVEPKSKNYDICDVCGSNCGQCGRSGKTSRNGSGVFDKLTKDLEKQYKTKRDK